MLRFEQEGRQIANKHNEEDQDSLPLLLSRIGTNGLYLFNLNIDPLAGYPSNNPLPSHTLH